MYRLIGAGLLFASLACCLTQSQLLAQKKKRPDASSSKVIDSDKLTPGEFVGLLKAPPGSDRSFPLEISLPKLVPTGSTAARGNSNTNRILQYQLQLQQAQAQLISANNPQQRQRAQQRMQRIQRQLLSSLMNLQRSGGAPPGYRLEKVKTEIDFQASDKVKVRTLVLPEIYDDKGNLQKYSPQQLNDLKGRDRSLPGYESSLDKLQAGQQLRVVLARSSNASSDQQEDSTSEKKMQATLIVILAEPSENSLPKGKANKKK